MTLPLKGKIIAGVRSYLLQDSELVSLLGHTNTHNKITIDQLDQDVVWPVIALRAFSGGRINSDPFPDFDVFMRAEVLGNNLRQLYPIYGRVEVILTDVMLPTAFDVQYYAPVRVTDNTFFDSFKIAQQDLYRLSSTFRIRGVMLNGN